MESKLLICTVGLPYAGKTTWALSQDCPIVSPDGLRVALHGARFIMPAEPMIWTMTDYMIIALFVAGHDKVILDSTCNTANRRQERILYGQTGGYQVKFEYFKTSAKVCADRARFAHDEDIIPTIIRMDEERDWDIEKKAPGGEKTSEKDVH